MKYIFYTKSYELSSLRTKDGKVQIRTKDVNKNKYKKDLIIETKGLF